jgi:hypothetical protein
VFVPVSVTVTAALAIAPPDASVTVPRIDPVDWAIIIWGSAIERNSRTGSEYAFFTDAP